MALHCVCTFIHLKGTRPVMVRYDILLAQRVERAGEVLRGPAARPLLEVRAALSNRHRAVRCSDGC